MNKIEVEILGLSSSPSAAGAYALLLKEKFGIRRLPIIIGAFEAQAIALELESITPPRPLTHDLIKLVIDHLNATVSQVIITDLIDTTFYAEIVLKLSDFETIVDSRPSDAIAIAVRANCPIYVSEKVMNKASFLPASINEKSKEDKNTNDLSDETEIASLQEQLRIAIENENYETAASIRDKINKLKS